MFWRGLIAFCLVSFLKPTVARAQTIEEVIRLNIVQFVTDEPSSPEEISRLWINAVYREKGRIGSWFPIDQPPKHLSQEEIEFSNRIRPILAELTEKRNLAYSFPEGSIERKQLQNECQSEEVSKQLFWVVGVEYATKFMVRNAERDLKRLVNDSGAEGLIAFLDKADKMKVVHIPALAEIREELDQLRKQLSEIKESLIEEADQIQLEKFERILDALPANQKEVGRKLIGKPIPWFLVAENHLAQFEQISDIATFTLLDRTGALELSKLDSMTDDELARKGIVNFDPILFKLIEDPIIQKELEISTDQIDEFRSSEFKNTISASRGLSARTTDLINGVSKLPESLGRILLESQRVSLAQFELQVRLGSQYQSTFGLLNPEMVSKLKLDSDQVKGIDEIAIEFDGKLKAVVDKHKKDASSLREKALSLIKPFSDSLRRTLPQ